MFTILRKICKLPYKELTFLASDIICTTSLIGICGFLFLEVMVRYFGGRSIGPTTEIGGSVLVIMTFMSLGLIFRRGGHMRIVMVLDRLPYKQRQVAEFGLGILSLVFVCFTGYLLWQMFYATFKSGSRFQVLDVVVWPVEMFALLGWGILALAVMEFTVRKGREIFG